jgi:hypothetical protein
VAQRDGCGACDAMSNVRCIDGNWEADANAIGTPSPCTSDDEDEAQGEAA